MKIYASRNPSDLEILQNMVGKDIWVKTICKYRPSFYCWLKVREVDDYFQEIFIHGNRVQQSINNEQFLINGFYSYFDRREAVRDEMLYEGDISYALDEFDIVKPVEYLTTDELLDTIIITQNRWLESE